MEGLSRYNDEQVFPAGAPWSQVPPQLVATPQPETGGLLNERYTRSDGARERPA
jgi:hypothetical protein